MTDKVTYMAYTVVTELDSNSVLQTPAHCPSPYMCIGSGPAQPSLLL